MKNKLSDKIGMSFILTAIKGMSKKKLMGLLAIINNANSDEQTEKAQIFLAIKNEWEKRKYDKIEFENYIKILEE